MGTWAREFLRLGRLLFRHSPKKSGAAGATCTLTRLAAQRFLRPPGLLFHARPQNGRGGRSRTGTGNDAQRGLSPPCLHSNHAAIKWCGQRESHPHELALTGFSLRRVYCFATSAKTGASTGTCALLSVLPRQSVAFYGLDAKWSKRKDSHLRSPEGQRVYSASQLLLCHASKKMGARAGFAPAAFSL
jgi:hypothetical protein